VGEQVLDEEAGLGEQVLDDEAHAGLVFRVTVGYGPRSRTLLSECFLSGPDCEMC